MKSCWQRPKIKIVSVSSLQWQWFSTCYKILSSSEIWLAIMVRLFFTYLFLLSFAIWVFFSLICRMRLLFVYITKVCQGKEIFWPNYNHKFPIIHWTLYTMQCCLYLFWVKRSTACTISAFLLLLFLLLDFSPVDFGAPFKAILVRDAPNLYCTNYSAALSIW